MRPLVDSTTLIKLNGGFPPKLCMVDSHHYIAITMGTIAQRSSVITAHTILERRPNDWSKTENSNRAHSTNWHHGG